MKTFILIFGGIVWGGGLGFLWFHILYLQTKKTFSAGHTLVTNPLRLFIFTVLLFVPVFLGYTALLAAFGGFALGFGIWWVWYSRHTHGGSNG